MRAPWLRGVLAGTAAVLWPVMAAAQTGQPVQVVPITPVGRTPAPVATAPAPQSPAGPTAQTPAPRQAPVELPPVARPLTAAPQTQTAPMSPAAVPSPTSDSGRKLDLSFSNGRVHLVADNVTVGDILAEWARKGGTVMDNADKLGGGPVSFAFENESELKVLQALLRPYPGMIVVPRPLVSATTSSFSRVNIVSRSTATSGFVAPPSNGAPQYQASQEDEMPPVAIPPARMQAPPPSSAPSGPVTMPTAGQGGAARPGVVIAPVTPTPGAVVPGQIIK